MRFLLNLQDLSCVAPSSASRSGGQSFENGKTDGLTTVYVIFGTMRGFFSRAANLYVDGFRNMTWGKPLWIIIFLKLVILFGVLRLFFFKPDMAGLSDSQKTEIVGERLTTTKTIDKL